jgi:hemoglobin-like flavoprotein
MYFKHLFALAPYLLSLFPFKNEPDIYRSKSMELLASKKMMLINKLVEKCENLESMISYLRKLGKEHSNWGVQPQNFEFFRQAWLKTLKEIFKDEYTEVL